MTPPTATATSVPSDSIPRSRRILIERIATSAAKLPGTHDDELLDRFIRAYYRGVGEEDLADRRSSDLAAVALRHLRLGRRREHGRALVHVFNPERDHDGFSSARTLVAIVTDDMSFLIDSVGIVFQQAAIAVHLIVHPVLTVARDAAGRLRDVDVNAAGDHAADSAEHGQRESWQLFEIDHQSGPAALSSLAHKIAVSLQDVRAAVNDWTPMLRRVRDLIRALGQAPRGVEEAEASEMRKLLEWMVSEHFVFLGYRYYRLKRGAREDQLVPAVPSGLGLLRSGHGGARAPRTAKLRGELRRRAREPQLLVITKSSSIATVHRATYLDHVGVKDINARGVVVGEHRFLGLWTSSAYHCSPHDIPLMRRKLDKVVAHFGLAAHSHDAKAVVSVLETYPRDELFQASVPELIDTTRAVVNLYERRNVRLLVRRDPYGRFSSCMIYVPRDRYTTDVRERIERIVLKAFGGSQLESQVQISESSHARVHVLVRTDPQAPRVVDTLQVERAIALAARTWADRLQAALTVQRDESTARMLSERYAQVFPLSYHDDVEPAQAIEDIDAFEALRGDAFALSLNLRRPRAAKPTRIHLKIVKIGDPIPISDLLPMMENFGLRVIAERPYQLAWPDGGAAWVQDFEFEHRDGATIDIERIEARFNAAFLAVWRGEVENDGFNRLLLAARLGAREIVVVRAYCRYLLQSGLPFSQTSMERALASNPKIAAALVRLFEQSFDPHLPSRGREARREKLTKAIRASFDSVASVDDDRILRAYLTVIRATLRTNFYQSVVPHHKDAAAQPKPCVALKLDPQAIPDLPLPRPKFEIFVYSPRVEGVHLRMSFVARGGIRWSDRRDDFRTEVLGLMKAQNVKNTLIVPAGAKGGFVPKRLALGASREDVQREGIACYQAFIRSLLDVTDNIVGERIVPPPATVRRDGDDPYLVVAADKGTATFSDIANAISAEYGFWLDDAFASGGSAGYDHKAMGITARGAWECIKRHFRDLGLDTQTQSFTVAGIGDMSGDVFGNGMLLSRHIKLLAAFNHQHIFIDPQPDAARSFAERARLFALPRSGWDDYRRKILSKGGGIYPRASKTVNLAPEAQKLLGLASASVAPQDVIRAILRMPADLLWNGGIGTYVKASAESHAEVRDRSNDAVRVNGSELRVRVIGEGGNLGVSQRGRIEYALAGGRLNTDFIDNSAGVNTSDVEVNLKILLNGLEKAGKLARAQRNRLLRSMTREVASLVLRNNYLQSQAISTLALSASVRLPEYHQVIRALERGGDLNREIEFLPADEDIAERVRLGLGLTRPEIAVVLAYSKIWLSHQLLHSNVPEDPYLSRELERYFPRAVRERFPQAIARHRLRREIIVTATTNSLVNRMGPTFVLRAQADTGADPAQIARAYTIGREVFDMRDLWAEIEALDNRVAASAQYGMMERTSAVMRHVSYWLLGARRRELHVDRAVAEFRSATGQLAQTVGTLVTGCDRERYQGLRAKLIAAGIPARLAERVAGLEALEAAFDVIELAKQHRERVLEVGKLYFELGERTGLDWLREQIGALKVDGQWQPIARMGLREQAARVHRRLTEDVLKRGSRAAVAVRVTAWVEALGAQYEPWRRTLTDMRAAGKADFATLSVGVEAVRKLAEE